MRPERGGGNTARRARCGLVQTNMDAAISATAPSKFVSKSSAATSTQPSLFTPPPQQPTRAPVTTPISPPRYLLEADLVPATTAAMATQPVDVTDDAIQSDELLENALVAAGRRRRRWPLP